MQHPRRTSEFKENVDSKIPRQSQRGSTLTPSTVQKLPVRQSRLTKQTPTPIKTQKSTANSQNRLPTRPSSNDRATTSSRGVTPQKATTPLVKSAATYTAEKQRVGSGSMHNDKKWVQEQSQRITDYLREANAKNPIPGITADFFTRSGLRQMSIKHFVAIFNHFLHFISGNRFTVGSNHVEDIMNILQKINYPHAVSKSWLKTPNTQHSFGYVIVLFDYMMDFAPVGDEQEFEFDFEDPKDCVDTETEDDRYKMPDAEFQSILLKHAEQSFKLWDKNLTEEYNSLKKETLDLLIQKQCNLPDKAALDSEVENLKIECAKLKDECVVIADAEIMDYKELESELSSILNEHEAENVEEEDDAAQIKDLEKENNAVEHEIAQSKAEINELNTALRAQTCTAEERNNLLEKVERITHVLKTKERECNELENFNNEQQIAHIGAKAQLTKQIEYVNSQIRELCFSEICSDIKPYEIPVNPDFGDLKNAVTALKAIREQLKQKIDENERKLKLCEDEIMQTNNEIDEMLLPKIRSIASELATEEKNLADVEEQAENMRKSYESKDEILVANIKELDDFIAAYEKVVSEKKEEVEQLKQQNEKFMTATEEKYNAFANMREDYLTKYEQTLNVAKERLVEVRTLVDETDQVLANLKLEAK